MIKIRKRRGRPAFDVTPKKGEMYVNVYDGSVWSITILDVDAGGFHYRQEDQNPLKVTPFTSYETIDEFNSDAGVFYKDCTTEYRDKLFLFSQEEQALVAILGIEAAVKALGINIEETTSN